MSATLDRWLRCPILPTGRRLRALKGVREALAGREPRVLSGLLQDAAEHDARTLELEREWRVLSRQDAVEQSHPPLAAVDEELDHALDALYNALQVLLREGARNDPRVDDAYILLDVVFPAGACSVTSLPYIDQMGAVDALLEELQGSLLEHVTSAGVVALVDEIARLGERYRDELANLSPEELVLEQLLNAREEGHRFLLQIVAVALGAHHRNTHDAIGARAALLSPIEREAAEAAQAAARGEAVDVDPATGLATSG